MLLNVVTDSLFNTQASCLKCPPSAWIHFLSRVNRELVTLRSTTALLMFLEALRIRWSSICPLLPNGILMMTS